MEQKPLLARMYPDIPISEENLKLKSMIGSIKAEDMKVIKEIVKLEKEIEILKGDKIWP